VHINAVSAFSASSSLISLIYNVINILGGIIGVLIWPALAVFFCTFPDGRFVPRWSWILPGLFIVQYGFYVLPPPWNYLNWPPLLQLLEELLVFGSTIGTQFYRYFFAASPVQRQQIKWLAFGFALIVFVAFPLESFLQAQALHDPHSLAPLSVPFTTMLDYLSIPLAIGIALLRYRLWDIDVLINRTLVYGLLTLILALVYAGLVFGGEALLVGVIGQSNGIVIVGSTLIVAVLFQPLRHRIQQVIDRRFNRRKYDAAKTLAAFSATLRNEVDLDQLSEELLAVVQETMQPAHVSLWLRKNEQPSKPNPDE
jgi:MFS family permease